MTRVLKFGGTSLGDGERVRRVAEIVGAVAEAGEVKPVVVASAHAGITNLLLAAAEDALAGVEDPVRPVRERQFAILDELNLSHDLIGDELEHLTGILKGIALLGERSPRTLDAVASFGERMSTRALAAELRRLGYKAAAHRAWDLGLITTRKFGHARPLPEAEGLIRERLQMKLDEGEIPIITGFIGKSEDGVITTLGRNGSDYSAAIFGAAVGADEIQIWTDVPGILTTDPRVVDGTRVIPALSFAEASELANYGAKVIHPATLTPAVEKSIPIRVKSTLEPDAPGSLIVPESDRTEEVVKAIAHKTGITLVHIHSTRMLGRPGFLSRIAKVFQIHRIDVDMIATSEVSVSLTVEDSTHLDRAVKRLGTFARVKVVRDRAIVCVVGEGLADEPGCLARVFGALAESQTAIDLISQGASRLNLGLVVAAEGVETVVRGLHAALFPSEASA